MAPDLNSVPASPRPQPAPTATPATTATTSATSPRPPSILPTSSRRTSQAMPPPSLPMSPSSLNILPSNQAPVHHLSPPLMSPSLPTAATGPVVGDNTGVGAGPGPLRHPRPLTAADLHMQLEKEQEAVVNRLTRELSLLRAAQNASVASNTSSTSGAGLPDSGDWNANHLLSGPSHPTPSLRRHERSGSSTSTRSFTTVGGVQGSSVGGITARGPLNRHDSSQSLSLSRQNSMTGSTNRRSGASSPAPLSSSYNQHMGDHFPYFYSQRPERPVPHRDLSGSVEGITTVQTTGRYEEMAYHRSELESVKRENEQLKRRIRELERGLRDKERVRRESDVSARGGVVGARGRSESVSTTASGVGGVAVGIGGGVSIAAEGNSSRGGVGRGRERDKDEEVRVGESARSSGVGRRGDA